MSSPNVQELYDCYDIVNNNDEKEEIKKAAYEKILKGVNGEEKEKRLASQFIANFFKLFPALYEDSFNKLLDLCEDENVIIRKQVIQYMSVIAKSVSEYIPKIADTLIQMLNTDDNTEVSLIYSALNNVIKLDSKVALEAIFNQLITQLDESTDMINTFAFKYLNDKFTSDNDFKVDVESVIEAHASKLLCKLSGKDEFQLVVGILSSLKSYSTLTGRQKLISEITEQTKSLGKINSIAKYSSLILNCKQAVKLISKNVHADDLLRLLVDNLADIVKLELPESGVNLIDLWRCVVDLTNRGLNADLNAVSTLEFTGDDGLKTITNVLQICLDRLPVADNDVTTELLYKYSEDTDRLKELECLLIATHNLCRYRPDVVNSNEELNKQFKLRLQFLGRFNQLAQKKATEVVKGQAATEGRDRALLAKATGNIQILIREFFKPSPTFKTLISPSWHAPIETAVKRPAPFANNSGTKIMYPKRGNQFNKRSRR